MRHGIDHLINVQRREGENKAAVRHPHRTPKRHTNPTCPLKARSHPLSTNLVMVRDTCTHHDGETCNSRMTALQPAASSSRHLLRARMRRLVMSTNLKADHRECPRCNHQRAKIANLTCVHGQSSANRTSVCPANMPRTFTSACE